MEVVKLVLEVGPEDTPPIPNHGGSCEFQPREVTVTAPWTEGGHLQVNVVGPRITSKGAEHASARGSTWNGKGWEDPQVVQDAIATWHRVVAGARRETPVEEA